MRYFLFIGAVLLGGCLLDPEEAETTLGGTYDFTAYKEDGTVETRGWIQLNLQEDGSIDGAWELAGLQGDGQLAGRKERDVITLNLHPGWADHNFMITGSQKNTTLRGTWEFIGFAGPMSSGTFVAEK